MDSVKAFASITTAVLFDLLIIIFAIDLFFKIDATLIAGIISFCGAIIGGAITYLGVKQTLRHRDREIFMGTVGKKIFIIEDSIDELKSFINALFFMEQQVMDDKNEKGLNVVEKYRQQLKLEYKKIRELHDYDFVKILKFKIKSFEFILDKIQSTQQIIVEEDLNECIEKARDIFGLLLKQKEILENDYYKYNK